jgi:hypothetical protein
MVNECVRICSNLCCMKHNLYGIARYRRNPAGDVDKTTMKAQIPCQIFQNAGALSVLCRSECRRRQHVMRPCPRHIGAGRFPSLSIRPPSTPNVHAQDSDAEARKPANRQLASGGPPTRRGLASVALPSSRSTAYFRPFAEGYSPVFEHYLWSTR